MVTGASPNPMIPVAMHSLVYAAIGGAGGLAFGYGLLGRTGAAKAGLAGIMGAVLGSVFFAVLHTLFFPMEWDFSPLPGKRSRVWSPIFAWRYWR